LQAVISTNEEDTLALSGRRRDQKAQRQQRTPHAKQETLHAR
jgi:3'-phosphoadenosine 5'-phosphosulfate sulfotransferase (PAPS reductase)/FAD synthetase